MRTRSPLEVLAWIAVFLIIAVVIIKALALL